MAQTITKQNEDLIKRLIRTGRYNNQSEVVRAGLRLLEEKEFSYLNPPPLPKDAWTKAYRRNKAKEDAEELAMCRSCAKGGE